MKPETVGMSSAVGGGEKAQGLNTNWTTFCCTDQQLGEVRHPYPVSPAARQINDKSED
jgi:hypothetical protein